MRASALVLIAMLLAGHSLSSQELEPRLLTNVPIGTNFTALGYGYSVGNTLLDPAVPIENLDSRLHTLIGAYVRAIDVFGLSGKIDAVVPFALGDWTAQLAGQDTTRSIDGFGDPRFRLSVNVLGAPALRMPEFLSYRQKTIVGASLQVIAPLGQYDPERLINLSSNRWTFRSTLGVSQAVGPWFLEWYVAGWL